MLRDDALEVDAQRLVQQHALDRRRVEQPRELVDRSVELRGRRAARVGELRAQLPGEEERDLLQLGQRANARPDCAAVGISLLADRQKARRVPQTRAPLIREHRDDRVAQVTVRRRADVRVGEQMLERGDDVVGDDVRRRIDRERVEPAGGVRKIEQRAGAAARDEAQRGVRGVTLRIEHDHRAALAAQVLGHRRDQVARLALLNRTRHGGVLTPQRDRDRHRPERVHERPRLGGRPKHPGWRRSDR